MSTGFSDQHSTLEFTSQDLVDAARLELELAFHECRLWAIPSYEQANWDEMKESNILPDFPFPNLFTLGIHVMLAAVSGGEATVHSQLR